MHAGVWNWTCFMYQFFLCMNLPPLGFSKLVLFELSLYCNPWSKPETSLNKLGFEQWLSTFSSTHAECPLDMAGSNYTLTASICSNKEDRGKCCRYINALIAISVARYANSTSNLGVNAELSKICLDKIAETFQFHGVTRNATVFCGFGTKIPVNYDCQGRTTVTQMLQSPQFSSVTRNCQVPLSVESDCRKCLNAGILYLRNLVGTANNITFSTCRDATYAALASQVDNASAIDIARCFFGVHGLSIPPGTH